MPWPQSAGRDRSQGRHSASVSRAERPATRGSGGPDSASPRRRPPPPPRGAASPALEGSRVHLSLKQTKPSDQIIGEADGGSKPDPVRSDNRSAAAPVVGGRGRYGPSAGADSHGPARPVDVCSPGKWGAAGPTQ